MFKLGKKKRKAIKQPPWEKDFLQNKYVINLLDKRNTILYKKSKTLKPQVFELENELRVHQGEKVPMSHKEIIYVYLRRKARKYLSQRALELAICYNLEFNRVVVKDTKSRWGSCSNRKNINLNWKLILTEKGCLDYVIVHELAHLIHMNHSKDYWNEVEKMMPDYKVWLKKLREWEKILK